MNWKLQIFTRALCLSVGFVLSVQPAVAQSDRVVALVVSVGDGAARADAVQTELQAMSVETLRLTNPNNAEVRSMLLRFADASEDARATFVYLDMPAVDFAGRQYVLADTVGLNKPTDLFTSSIPLPAFARTAALAEQGGAVVIAVSEPVNGFPAGLVKLSAAPDPVPGAGAILVVDEANADPILQTITAAGRDEAVEIGAMFRRMTVHDGVSVSALPDTQIFLRAPPEPEIEPTPIVPIISEATPVNTETQEVPQVQAEPEPQETLEELTILEQSLSRSAKRSIQQGLRKFGHYKGLVDGIFGPQTREAITAFQSSRTEEPTGLLSRRQLLDLRAPG